MATMLDLSEKGADLLAATKTWKQFIAQLVLLVLVGIGYWDTHTTQNRQFAALVVKMDDHAEITRLINQRITRHDWDLDRHADRISGQAEKNLEQDTRIRQIELRLAATRLPSNQYPNPPYEEPIYPQK